MDFKTFLQSRFATFILAVMLVLVMVVMAKLLVQKREVDNEIKQLQARADQVHTENRELSELIKYLNTDEYTERQAREKLNLKKEGEIVVVLPKDKDGSSDVAGAATDSRSNPVKWYNYFFGER